MGRVEEVRNKGEESLLLFVVFLVNSPDTLCITWSDTERHVCTDGSSLASLWAKLKHQLPHMSSGVRLLDKSCHMTY